MDIVKIEGSIDLPSVNMSNLLDKITQMSRRNEISFNIYKLLTKNIRFEICAVVDETAMTIEEKIYGICLGLDE